MTQIIEQFHREAINKNLSAGAILLWQQLYFTMERKQQFDNLQQSTAVLMAQLKVTRQGLAVMRQTLADRGFLAVRVDEHQQTFYTLMIDGKVVGESSPLRHAPRATTPEGRGFDEPAAKMPISSPSGRAAERSEAERASGDIILTNRIRPYIDIFCETFGPAMKGDLIQWAEMRRKNGWTLTLWGLEELFKKLIQLSAGNAVQMAQIVAQSVTRRWKGFFALKVKAKPSGDALRKQEEEQDARSRRPWEKRNPLQKFKPEGRDLSFLEV